MFSSKKRIVFAGLCVLALLAACHGGAGSAAACPTASSGLGKRLQQLTHKGEPTPGRRPNVVLITTDDQTTSEMRWMPQTRALLGGGGARFTDALSPHPLCCPARAMILTGQFAHNNGVRSNFWPSGGYYKLKSGDTLPVWLKHAGYQTAFVGKYLNEYGERDPREVPPGWDHWRSPVSGVYDYYRFTVNRDGELRRRSGTYQTTYYADQTEQLIHDMAAEDQPFFLWQSNLAPHRACTTARGRSCWDDPTPDAAYQRSCDDLNPPGQRDPSYNERNVSDKPQFISTRPPLGRGKQHQLTELFHRRVESLQSVDDTVTRTVVALREAGVLDDTLVIFTSDNGYLLGQHRYTGKNVGYEPALRVPLLMRGPSVPPGVRRSATVGLVDLAPTILDATGARAGLPVDGRSLLGVAAGQAPGWDTMLIQGGPRKANTGDAWFYRGVRTRRYTYIEYRHTGEVELYDRRRDPHQLRNVAGDRAYRDTQAELRRRLQVLQGCAGDACRQEFGRVPPPRR